MAFLVLASTCAAFEFPEPEYFHNGLSLQGYTGILNTPNAYVTEEGSIYAQYSNQKESMWRKSTRTQDNTMLSVGFLSIVEVGGRLTVRPGSGNRDLSANFKFSSEPLTRKYPYLPVLALGMQDLTGGAKLLQTKYAVLSQDFWRFRASAGYGNGPNRMKGGFGGVEFKAHEWVYLLAEHDTKETNVGARLVSPRLWKVPGNLTAIAKTSLDHNPGSFEFALGLTIALDSRAEKRPATRRGGKEQGDAAKEVLPAAARQPDAGGSVEIREQKQASPVQPGAVPIEAEGAGRKLPSAVLSGLRDHLVRQGFINVRTGSTPSGTLVVEYENARFNHNELDGLGVVAGTALREAKEDFKELRIILKRHDIAMARFTAPMPSFSGFLDGNIGPAEFNQVLQIGFDSSNDDAEFLPGTGNPGFLKSSLMLYPGLTTFIGTEFGAFDYLLSLKPELFVNAWKGGVVDARWDIPVSWSSNLDDGAAFRDRRHPPRLERLMMFQALKPYQSVMANFGAGMILHETYGTLNEAVWSPNNGNHRFRVVQAYGKNSQTQRRSEVYLGAYRYYFAPLDLSLEATGGKFWYQDTGASFEIKRFFGDAAVSFYYKHTEGSDNRKWQAAGIRFSFPLTPGKDMKHVYSAQVRGNEEWTYAQETTLKNKNVDDGRGALNYLAPYPLATDPLPATALYRAYYNRDRLSEAYIRSHLRRVRQAWQGYGSDL